MTPDLPKAYFEIKGDKYKINQKVFILPGLNKSKPITAGEALRNAEILIKLVEIRSGVLTKIL